MHDGGYILVEFVKIDIRFNKVVTGVLIVGEITRAEGPDRLTHICIYINGLKLKVKYLDISLWGIISWYTILAKFI